MTNIDLIANGQANGDLAAYAMAQGKMDASILRPYIGKDGKTYITVHTGGSASDHKNYKSIQVNSTSGTLRRDEWKLLDDAIMGVSRERLQGIASLESRGLVYNLGNAMGTTVLEYHEMSDFMEASVSMDGNTQGQNDRANYKTKYLPLPIIHVDYQINARVLATSRNMGNGLDTTSAEQAARRVAEKLEDMLFTNMTYPYGGGTIYSYINHPDRNPQTLTKRWDASDKTGKDIIDDVVAMKQKSINDSHYGPWELYIPTAYETVLDKDYDSTTPGTTIRERILKIDGITAIKTIDRLTAHNVLLVQMTSDVVRLVKGMGLTNIEWSANGKMVKNYKVMTIQVPQVRSDAGGKSGIIHLAE